MAKLTAAETRLHDQACQLVFGMDRALNPDEVEFVLEHWLPDANHNVAKNAAFFTPLEVADVLAMFMAPSGRCRILDLCAGTGRLTWAMMQTRRLYQDVEPAEYVAIEVNPDYVAVGRRILPEVEWIVGNMFDRDLLARLGRFAVTLCNPPFGNAVTKDGVDTRWLRYGGPAGLMAAEVAMRVTERAAGFILLEMQVPFGIRRHLGPEYWYHKRDGEKGGDLRRFERLFPYIHLSSFRVDLSEFKWRDVAPQIHLVDINTDPYCVQLNLDKHSDPIAKDGDFQFSLFN